jgi:hypothetical protein
MYLNNAQLARFLKQTLNPLARIVPLLTNLLLSLSL